MNIIELNSEKLYIDGQFVDASSGELIDVENPATEEIIAKIPSASKEDIDKACNAAYEAFKTYSKTSLDERITYMEKLKDWIVNHQDDFDEIILLELGIPKHIGHDSQVKTQIERIETFIKEVKNIKTEEEYEGGLLLREPIGLVASITPWNYPLGQIVQKVIPAL